MEGELPKINFTSKNKKAVRFVYYAIFTIAFVFVAYLLFLTFVLQSSSLNCDAEGNCNTRRVADSLIGDNGNNITGIKGDLNSQLLAQNEIKKFDSYAELELFLEENTSGNNYYGGYGLGMPMMVEEMAVIDSVGDFERSVESMDSSEGFGGGSDDFSQTNIQVEGVDEADIIKSDGKYIYAVSGNNLFIIDAYPAQGAQILSKIAFESRPQNIYINDNRLIVYGYDDLIYRAELYDTFRRKSSYTFFKIFDITDRVNPKQVRDLDFEGNIVNSRMIGDYVYFITSQNAIYYEDEMPVPRIIENDMVINDEKIMDVYYIDVPYSSYNYTHVAAINVKDETEEINSEAYLLSYGQNLYVSKDNIYITYTRYISEYQIMMEVMREFLLPRLPEKDQLKIKEIEAVSNYVLNRDEKMAKVMSIIERYIYSLPTIEQNELEQEMENKVKQKYEDISKELEKTIIHKIGIEKGRLEYKTVGEVTGNVLNQFSMDEQGEYFRIATTKNRTWSRFDNDNTESYSNLYVLNDNLKVVGKIEGLAEGERIYSVRFMQDRAYLVTFKQVDPLFVIDLKNPKNPKVLGELKIPGFSNYLHPYDDNTLIGLGKDTYENEWGGVRTGGIKLSLFDVSDVSSPKEIDNFVLGGSGSDSFALYDHRAFLFSRDKNLLAIPVTIVEDGITKRFRGSLVFNVNEKGFELKGKVSHDSGNNDSLIKRLYYYDYNESVKRNLYIDNVFYSFSDRYLIMNDLDDLDLIKKLELKKAASPDDDFIIVN